MFEAFKAGISVVIDHWPAVFQALKVSGCNRLIKEIALYLDLTINYTYIAGIFKKTKSMLLIKNKCFFPLFSHLIHRKFFVVALKLQTSKWNSQVGYLKVTFFLSINLVKF